MCSNECDCDPVSEGLKAGLDLTGRCRKCGSEPFIILDRVHVECKACFTESCNKKLRSTIGKSKLVRNNDSILIACSGGPSSCALLDLISTSIKSQNRREQKFRPSIVHIDMQSLISNDETPSNLEHRRANLDEFLRHLVSMYPGWPVYWSTIERGFIMDGEHSLFFEYNPDLGIEDVGNPLLNDADARSLMLSIINEQNDLTEKQQLLADRTTEFISRLAAKINETLAESERFKFVMVASSATQLANNLLVDVILGRGATVCSTVNICDRRAQVPVMRPMRDFSKKEVAFYLRARKIEARVRPNSLLTLKPHKSSIQALTENFLSKLYVDYPSTYSTLLRTGNKMQE